MKNLNNFSTTETQADAILAFYHQLTPLFILPCGVKIMNPFKNALSWQTTEAFYRKFYTDKNPRYLIFGINPGRFGGGITGVPFTDPIRLEETCGIKNEFRKLPELSSLFVYSVVQQYGGANAFFKDYFITALSPLGFTKNGINLNYYDEKELLKAIEPFMVDCIRKQTTTIATRNICFCFGEGTNYKVFKKLNEKHDFFKQIIPLPHPRWIMQYKRKKIDEYIELYLKSLRYEDGKQDLPSLSLIEGK